MKTAKQEIRSNEFMFECGSDNVRKRFQTSLEWYIQKACFYKRLYYVLIMVATVCPIIVTAFNCFVTSDTAGVAKTAQCFIFVLSIFVSISTAVLTLSRAQERWIEYRSAAEYLKSAWSLYMDEIKRLGPETEEGKEKEREFLIDIEDYMMKENARWKKNVSESDDGQGK